MSWHVEYRAPQALIATEITGIVTARELTACVSAAIAVARDHAARLFLTDCTQLQGGHSVFDLFALAEQLHKLGMPRDSREALVVPATAQPAIDARFWETVCRNRGFTVRTFAAMPAAVAWLLGAKPARRGARVTSPRSSG